jgi:phosphatidylglycerophosphate synthase
MTLLLGVSAAYCFMLGSAPAANLGAAMYMLAVFSDHLDGELARLSGKTSRFGHYFDFVVVGVNYTLLFAAIGIGLEPHLGFWPLALGLAAASCNPVIMVLRMRMDEAYGLEATEHPEFGWFNLEDFVYAVGPLTWLFGVVYFFVPFALGTVGYLIWTVARYRQWFSHEGVRQTGNQS